MGITKVEATYLKNRAQRAGVKNPDEQTLLLWLQEFRNPAPQGKAKSVCPGCGREHYVNPKDYPYGMNPTGVYCPSCVFKIED